jgi:hypothetical protein
MQQRRFRPGDVLDDYCPRERRITDHAVVAMIDDRIKQTRCVVCDAEHEYKEGKVPPQRRKPPQAALFAQVLDGLQAPQRVARRASDDELDELPIDPPPSLDLDLSPPIPSPAHIAGNGRSGDVRVPTATSVIGANPAVDGKTPAASDADTPRVPEEGPVRRPLIRATLPRPEGQPVVTRAMPEFTIRQPQNGRGGHRGSGRRRGAQSAQGHGGHGGHGQRFGHGGPAQGQHGQGGRHQGGHGRPGGSRRGGKKR